MSCLNNKNLPEINVLNAIRTNGGEVIHIRAIKLFLDNKVAIVVNIDYPASCYLFLFDFKDSKWKLLNLSHSQYMKQNRGEHEIVDASWWHPNKKLP